MRHLRWIQLAHLVPVGIGDNGLALDPLPAVSIPHPVHRSGLGAGANAKVAGLVLLLVGHDDRVGLLGLRAAELGLLGWGEVADLVPVGSCDDRLILDPLPGLLVPRPVDGRGLVGLKDAVAVLLRHLLGGDDWCRFGRLALRGRRDVRRDDHFAVVRRLGGEVQNPATHELVDLRLVLGVILVDVDLVAATVNVAVGRATESWLVLFRSGVRPEVCDRVDARRQAPGNRDSLPLVGSCSCCGRSHND